MMLGLVVSVGRSVGRSFDFGASNQKVTSIYII